MLTRRCLPGDAANAIEANQAELRAEPEIPTGRPGNRVDIAIDEPTPDGPRSMRVLADIQGWIQRKNRRRPEQHVERAKRNECQRRS